MSSKPIPVGPLSSQQTHSVSEHSQNYNLDSTKQMLENSALFLDANQGQSFNGSFSQSNNTQLFASDQFAQPPQPFSQPPFQPQSQTSTFLSSSMAEKRASHNAVERARREVFSSKFNELASHLPSLHGNRKPTKSVIVHKSVDYIIDLKSRCEKYENVVRMLCGRQDVLRSELNKMRQLMGLPVLQALPEEVQMVKDVLSNGIASGPSTPRGPLTGPLALKVGKQEFQGRSYSTGNDLYSYSAGKVSALSQALSHGVDHSLSHAPYSNGIESFANAMDHSLSHPMPYAMSQPLSHALSLGMSRTLSHGIDSMSHTMSPMSHTIDAYSSSLSKFNPSLMFSPSLTPLDPEEEFLRSPTPYEPEVLDTSVCTTLSNDCVPNDATMTVTMDSATDPHMNSLENSFHLKSSHDGQLDMMIEEELMKETTALHLSDQVLFEKLMHPSIQISETASDNAVDIPETLHSYGSLDNTPTSGFPYKFSLPRINTANLVPSTPMNTPLSGSHLNGNPLASQPLSANRTLGKSFDQSQNTFFPPALNQQALLSSLNAYQQQQSVAALMQRRQNASNHPSLDSLNQ